MKNILEREKKKLNKIFQDIGCFCKDCDLCCFTYGWLLPSEADNYDSVIDMNDCVHCLDSFQRDKEGQRILDKIPRCKYYENSKCQIHEMKPFDCVLYPVKVLYNIKTKSFLAVLSLDCPYIESLGAFKRSELLKNLEQYFDKMDLDLRQEYFEMVKQWALITKPKKFKYCIIKEFKDNK